MQISKNSLIAYLQDPTVPTLSQLTPMYKPLTIHRNVSMGSISFGIHISENRVETPLKATQDVRKKIFQPGCFSLR
jgi:hypothetical protein